MSYQRILTIQDISCVGQCSLTVALPILSACGHETAILPSAVLSTHTAGFTGFTVRDLTEEMPPISAHWQKEGLTFSAIYTGYLGSTKQIGYVADIFDTNGAEGCRYMVDPAMADHGKLYPAFGMDYVEAMKTLCAKAHVLLPNITEACLLTGMPYKDVYDHAYVLEMLEKLSALMQGGIVVLTGVGYEDGVTGVVVYENGVEQYYSHEKLNRCCHGTGDVYASAFVGAYMKGKTAYEAAVIAADYTLSCIKYTHYTDESHWYGVKFEPVLCELMEKLK